MLKHFHSCFVMGLSLAAMKPAPEPSSAGDGPSEMELRPEAAAAWRRELKKRLDLAERRVMSQWGPEAALSARRMVTVWLDELLLTAPWPGRKLWISKPLQKDWAEGRSGGQWFFEELEILTPDRRDNRELAALALRCLTLGLAGRYGRSPEQLLKVRRETLDRFGFLADSPVFPPPMPRRSAKKVWLGPLARRLLLGLGLGLLLFWLAGDLSLNRRLDRIHHEAAGFDYEPAPAVAGSLHGRLLPGEELK